MNRFKDNSQFWTQVAGLVLAAIAYWIAVRIGLFFVLKPEGLVASIWPASGLALALLLLSPKRRWPALLAVIFVINAAGNYLSGGNTLPVSLGFALANSLEALLGAWALTWVCKSKITFGRTVEIFALFGVAIFSNGLTALLGAAIPALASGAPFMRAWLVWWTADGLGILLVTPLIVTWATSQSMFQTASPRRIVEAVLLVIMLAVFSWLLFGNFTVAEAPVLRSYMLFPFLIWLAFRYSPRGMASALTLLAAIATWNTLQGYGIFGFGHETATEHLMSVQMLLSVTAFTGLLLSAIVTEQKQGGENLRASEDKFKYVFDNSTVGKSITLISGEINTNQALCDMLGYTLAEFKSKKWQEITHPDDIVLTQSEIDKLLSGQRDSARFVKRFIHKDGSVVWVDLSSSMRRAADGQPLYLMTSVIDITERKRAEEELQKLANVVSYSSELVNLSTLDGNMIFLNEAGSKMLGISPAEVEQTNIMQVIPTHFKKMVENELLPALLNTGNWIGDLQYLNLKTGQLTDVHATTFVIKDQITGAPLYLANVSLNITGRKQAENALRESELRNRALVGAMPDLIFVQNRAGVYVDYHAAKPQLLAAPPEVFLGHTVHEVLPPALADDFQFKIDQAFQTGEIQTHEYDIQLDDGLHYFEARMNAYAGDRILSVVRDITERKQAEEKIAASEAELRALFASMQDVVLVIDRQGVYRKIAPTNPALLVKPPEELLGKNLRDVFPAEQAEAFIAAMQQVLETRRSVRIEYELLIGERPTWFATSISPMDKDSTVWVARDITERKQAEDEIRQLNATLERRVEERTRELRDTQEKLVRHERLAVLGQLAGSVGHELRNPLAVIVNAVYFLKLVQPEASEKIKEYFGMIERETHNAEMILSDLLDFASDQAADRKSVSVSELVQRVLARFPAPASVTVSLDFPPDLPQVFADPRQMEQVLSNLTVNACQAMTAGGKLVISAKPSTVNGQPSVAIAVKDTGVGITPENMKKLFEPLFTTKPKGIGLGLVVSQKLTKANGGRIEVQSEAGAGSTFTLWLPVHAGEQ